MGARIILRRTGRIGWRPRAKTCPNMTLPTRTGYLGAAGARCGFISRVVHATRRETNMETLIEAHAPSATGPMPRSQTAERRLPARAWMSRARWRAIWRSRPRRSSAAACRRRPG
jgi:hypothetical protein